jgi:hypothetical protein
MFKLKDPGADNAELEFDNCVGLVVGLQLAEIVVRSGAFSEAFHNATTGNYSLEAHQMALTNTYRIKPSYETHNSIFSRFAEPSSIYLNATLVAVMSESEKEEGGSIILSNTSMVYENLEPMLTRMSSVQLRNVYVIMSILVHECARLFYFQCCAPCRLAAGETPPIACAPTAPPKVINDVLMEDMGEMVELQVSVRTD